MRLPLALLALLALAGTAAGTARAQVPSSLDPALLPPMEARGHEVYVRRFLLGNLPRAWAIASGGQYGGQWGGRSAENNRALALKSCREKGGTDCRIVVEDLAIVGQPAPPPPPGALIEGPGYGFVPDPRFFWHGPQQARGLLVWAHGFGGYNADYRGRQPPPLARVFNNAGYDIVRYERDPVTDEQADRVGAWMRAGLVTLKGMGWQQIILAGQSRGGYNALQMLAPPVPPVDVVIAFSPGAYGDSNSARIATIGQATNWTLVHNARAPGVRVVFGQFADDPFATEEDRRAALIRDELTPRVGSLLLIDRPAGITGHGGGETVPFAERFGACLLRFATQTPPPTACPGER